jgi:hypothetical protein
MPQLVNPTQQQMLDEMVNRLPTGTSNISATDMQNLLTPIIIKAWEVSQRPNGSELFSGTSAPENANAMGAVASDFYLGTTNGNLYQKSTNGLWVFLYNLIGKKGDKGEKGLKGDKGEPGPKGEDGKNGRNGSDGVDGRDAVGLKGDQGNDGKTGADGKSAYQIWLGLGNTGTVAEFIESLRGDSKFVVIPRNHWGTNDPPVALTTQEIVNDYLGGRRTPGGVTPEDPGSIIDLGIYVTTDELNELLKLYLLKTEYVPGSGEPGGTVTPGIDYQDVPDDVRKWVIEHPYSDNGGLTSKLTGTLLAKSVRGMYFNDKEGNLYVYMFGALDGQPNWFRYAGNKTVYISGGDGGSSTIQFTVSMLMAVLDQTGSNVTFSVDNDKLQINAPTPTPGPTYSAGANIAISPEGVISAVIPTGGEGGPTYTAGNNITISTSNVISANIPAYSAGDGIEISDAKVISAPSIFDEDQIDAIVGSYSPNYNNPFATKQTVPFSFFGDPIDYNIVQGYKGVPERFGWADNTIGSGFKRNIIGTYFGGNKIGNGVSQNTFGDNFLNNTLGDGSNCNFFHYYCTNNIFGKSLQGCSFHGLEHTTIGNNCGRIMGIGQTGYINMGDNCWNILLIHCDNPSVYLNIPAGTRDTIYWKGQVVAFGGGVPYTPGTGIAIDANNVISATSTSSGGITYRAGTKISIQADVINAIVPDVEQTIASGRSDTVPSVAATLAAFNELNNNAWFSSTNFNRLRVEDSGTGLTVTINPAIINLVPANGQYKIDLNTTTSKINYNLTHDGSAATSQGASGAAIIDFVNTTTVDGRTRVILYPGDYLTFIRTTTKVCAIIHSGNSKSIIGTISDASKTQIRNATYVHGEASGVQPQDSFPNAKFSDALYWYIYTLGEYDNNGAQYSWIRIPKGA